MRLPFFRIWYTRKSSWRDLGLYPNKRLWYFRTWKGGSASGTRTLVIGVVGVQLMVGVTPPKYWIKSFYRF